MRFLNVAFWIVAIAVGAYVAAILLFARGNVLAPDAREIEERLTSGGLPDARVVTAECPDEPRLREVGDRVTCTVILADGSRGRADVALMNDDGWISYELLRE